MKIIVAIGKDGAIGKNGDLIWKIPEDLKRFKALTTGNTIVMGRKTWESLPKKPLPLRRNIVVTRDADYRAEGAEVMHSPEEVKEKTAGENTFIIGGAEIYRQFLPYTDELFLTLVDEKCEDADTRLEINIAGGDWELIEESPSAHTPEGVNYKYCTYKRIPR